MSEFSGKCDLCDTIDIYEGTMNPQNTTIYVGDIGPLKYDRKEDLIPYYPYLTSIMTVSDKEIFIKLTRESFIDSEERDRLNFIYEDVIRLFNKAKREKKEFNFDYVQNKLGASWFISSDHKSLYKEMIYRVNKFGKKADISDLHTSIHNFYRKALYGVASKAGMAGHPLIISVHRKLLEYESFIKRYEADE